MFQTKHYDPVEAFEGGHYGPLQGFEKKKNYKVQSTLFTREREMKEKTIMSLIDVPQL